LAILLINYFCPICDNSHNTLKINTFIFQNMERFFWIDTHYACFGIVASGDTVTDAAPIASWMKGKRLQEIRAWLVRKKAKVVEVK